MSNAVIGFYGFEDTSGKTAVDALEFQFCALQPVTSPDNKAQVAVEVLTPAGKTV